MDRRARKSVAFADPIREAAQKHLSEAEPAIA